MILNLILAACIAFFAYLLRESTKENRKLASDSTSYQAKIKSLIRDIEIDHQENYRLKDRNSYLEGKLKEFSKENEALGAKNDQLTQISSIHKKEVDMLVKKIQQLEEHLTIPTVLKLDKLMPLVKPKPKPKPKKKTIKKK